MIMKISQHCPRPWQFWDPQWVSYIACLSLLSIFRWSGLTTIRLKLLLMSCPPTNLLRWGRSPPPLLEMAFLLQFSHRPSFWNEIELCQLLSGFSSRLTKSVLLHLNWPSLYKKVFQLHASSRQGVFTMTCAGSRAWNTGASFDIWEQVDTIEDFGALLTRDEKVMFWRRKTKKNSDPSGEIHLAIEIYIGLTICW